VKQWRFDTSLLADPREEQRDACGVGLIAHIKGEKSHTLVCDALEMLRNMDHRGGRAADDLSTDGAGILLQIPHALIERSSVRQGKILPKEGQYAVAMCFLPQERIELDFWLTALQTECEKFSLKLLFLRDVPIDLTVLGPIARSTLPHFQQAIFTFTEKIFDAQKFTRATFFFRKQLEELARDRYGQQQRDFYVASFSADNVCYKALVTSENLGAFYLDLQSPLFKSSYALTHLRFSTNTLPSWPLAQPFRTICHNGEINTLRGNINAMHARSFLFKNEELQSEIDAMGPVCTAGMSDSAMLDNAVEFLLHTQRSLPQVMSMLIPEPWEKNDDMSQELKDFYAYHSYLMEPWDGPALIGFCAGHQIGAILDRNGLRPARYCLTNTGHVYLASEAGVLPRRSDNIIEKGRLSPGRIFLIDTKKGAVLSDHQIKADMASRRPYSEWLKKHRVHLDELVGNTIPSAAPKTTEMHDDSVGTQWLKAFGYTKDELKIVVAPMANDGKEPDSSMGTDTPLAVLSKKRPLLFNYFKQLFAQVTNPPIDAIREEMVTSLTSYLSAGCNVLTEEPEHCSVVQLKHPILTNEDVSAIENLQTERLRTLRIDITFEYAQESLQNALLRIAREATVAIQTGASILILSDKNLSKTRAAIPALLATSSVHHALIRIGDRARCSLVVESGEPREVHHFALLLGYGAAAINPYLVFDLLASGRQEYGLKPDLSFSKLKGHYIKSVCDGLLKIMSKMGISTLHSYRGSQIFEALGLSQTLIDEHFTWTPSRIGGLELADIEEDIRARHQNAFGTGSEHWSKELDHGGEYQWHSNGEEHLHSPEMIVGLQNSTRLKSREEFKKFCATLDERSEKFLNLRSLLSFRTTQQAIPLDEVEPAESIVRRFSTGAMSFGSISKEAHETIAVAMNRIGARSNSGEGGEDPLRYGEDPNGDSRQSAIKQVASARFGVTISYLRHANELQIKMAQGAKPGEGGQLPGHKVDNVIARVRHSTPGITLISPPPHHDIYSIEDLAQLIYDLKNANRDARISVKLVSVAGIGTIAAGVAKAKAEVILVSGHEGGTGASPLSSIKHAGLPWELGLAETHRVLTETRLRDRVVLQVDGQLRTPRDIAIATLLGAQEWGIATGALISLGCIMMRKCHLNTCPVGIATQDPELRRKFSGQPESLINYVFLLAEGLREIMAQLGFRTVADMVGRVDLLEKNSNLTDKRVKKIDLSALLALPKTPLKILDSIIDKQDHKIEANLDSQKLLPAFYDALETHRPLRIDLQIYNTDRSLGTLLSSEVSKHFESQILPEDKFTLSFTGSAGQSFMAFGAAGITATLQGEANDYLCKGLSGATVAVHPTKSSETRFDNQVICGNTALYGATSGRVYVRGRAGERFAVRNSGAHAVVEGVGDHGCEYMTGGRVIVLGPVGRNFAAGMSGGLAYLYDPNQENIKRINSQMVELEVNLTAEDEQFVRNQLTEHFRMTESIIAQTILNRWDFEKQHFVCVVPRGFKTVTLGIDVAASSPSSHKPEVNVGLFSTSREIHGEAHG